MSVSSQIPEPKQRDAEAAERTQPRWFIALSFCVVVCMTVCAYFGGAMVAAIAVVCMLSVLGLMYASTRDEEFTPYLGVVFDRVEGLVRAMKGQPSSDKRRGRHRGRP